jgi:hypothetical protein
MAAASRTKAAARQPRTVGQKLQVADEDASVSRRRVVAAAPSFPGPNRGENKDFE